MADLLLTNYDLALVNGELQIVRGAEAVAQHVVMRLRSFLGEYVYDRGLGVPYQQVIFQRGTSLASIDQILRQVIVNTPGVVEVLDLDLDVDRGQQRLKARGRIRVTDDVVPFTLDTGGI